MQSGSEGRGGGRGGSRGGRGSRDSGDRGRGRGRGGSRGGGRGRGRSQAPATSLGVQKGGKLRSLKNQIRGVERLLRKEGIEPRAHTKQTALLEQLKTATKQHDQSELERKYAVRYHKIRFFERVKLERQIKQLEKPSSDETTEAELEKKQQDILKLRDDLQYVLNFPKGEKYVSIVKIAEDPKGAEALEKERSRLRAMVASQLAEIAMVTEADEGASLQAAATAAAAAAAVGQEAAESDEDDFFLPDDALDGDDAAVGADASGGVVKDEVAAVSITVAEEIPKMLTTAPAELPPLKRQRAGKAVALRAAAKQGSEAETSIPSQNGKPSASSITNIQKRKFAGVTASAWTGSAAQGANHGNSTAERPSPAGRGHSAPRGGGMLRSSRGGDTRLAGQQRVPVKKADWVPRGIAQQKQHRKFENSKPVPVQLRIPVPTADASAAPAVDLAPSRKRSQGGRKRRKKGE